MPTETPTTLPDCCRSAALLNTLTHLCHTIGERHLGSAGEEHCKDYLQQRFEAIGYIVEREPFAAPGWRYSDWEVSCAGTGPIDCFPCYFSPGGMVCAELATFLEGRDTDLSIFANKVVLAGNYNFDSVVGSNKLAADLEAIGAAALIINSPYGDTYSTKIVRNPDLKRMPVFTVSHRVSLQLAPHVGQSITLKLAAERFAHTSHNIVARSTPQQPTNKKLIIGAHYDTSPGIEGANDNGSGIALLLALAESLFGMWGDWAVDLVAFGGEEYGGPGYGIGGYNYVQQHQCTDANTHVMLCIDGVGSWLTQPEIRVGRSNALEQLCARECQRAHFKVVPFRRGSDQGIFDLHKIPTAWFCDGGPSNGVRHFGLHSPEDNLALQDMDQMERIAGDILALTRALIA